MAMYAYNGERFSLKQLVEHYVEVLNDEYQFHINGITVQNFGTMMGEADKPTFTRLFRKWRDEKIKNWEIIDLARYQEWMVICPDCRRDDDTVMVDETMLSHIIPACEECGRSFKPLEKATIIATNDKRDSNPFV